MLFSESLVRSERRSLSPSRCLQNESTATAESLQGTGLMVEGFNRGAERWSGRDTVPPCDPAAAWGLASLRSAIQCAASP
jgi:hypothetical protein